MKAIWNKVFATGVLMAVLMAVVLFAGAGSVGQASLIQSYLFGWASLLALVLGCFGFTLLHHTVRGSWSSALIRIFEAGGGPVAFLVTLLLWIPLYMNRVQIYHWQTDPAINTAFRRFWLMDANWTARIVGYFVIWIVYSYLMRSWDKAAETGDTEKYRIKRTNFAAPGLVLFFATGTLAATDLFMSIDHHWMSTMYGPLYLIGGAVFAMAMATFIVCANAEQPEYAEVVSPQLTKDMGNMCFTTCMLWIYFTLSQFIIIWSGNLRETITYYQNRLGPTLSLVGAATMVLGWFVPWTALLYPPFKAKPRPLMIIAGLLIVTRFLDFGWNLIPFFRPVYVWTDYVAALFAIGVWLAVFGHQMQGLAAVPTYDKRLKEAKLEHA